MLGLGMELLEGWSLSPQGFSTRDLAEQEAWLEAWRDGNPVQRGVWGFLHSAVCASFAGGVGWAHMGYPGPCLPGPTGPGRPPGQTALFTWDEVVP